MHVEGSLEMRLASVMMILQNYFTVVILFKFGNASRESQGPPTFARNLNDVMGMYQSLQPVACTCIYMLYMLYMYMYEGSGQ